ncbi:tyrosine-type recombinase/integrase [Saccharothrix obliqua]|uniref:tyrosine-type recombinase/integrase n=1 Tax=Saccharothrix obliqua TaxID=2861747 RepID=UPI001C5CF71A|nr:site-specific integrase [Saccharothrix obliqua]MBW4722451.1 site-specific integrase [Saccharothrix obliqua]
MGTVHELPVRTTATVKEAVAEFLDTRTGSTAATYRVTLRVLLGDRAGRPFAELDTAAGAAAVRARFEERWKGAAASTWNKHVSALRSAVAHWRDAELLVVDLAEGLALRKPPRPADRARGREDISGLLHDTSIPLRDRTLWSLLYDSAARSSEVLALNIEDLDLRNRRSKVRRKGDQPDDAPDVIAWHTRTARLLGRLIAGRTQGPVFLTDRAAKGAARGMVDLRDLDEATGRGRLSYRRAEELFKAASGGWTLHDLRHSALTHGAEDGMNAPMLMTKSGHRDIRTLARYARPTIAAVQRWEEQQRRER